MAHYLAKQCAHERSLFEKAVEERKAKARFNRRRDALLNTKTIVRMYI